METWKSVAGYEGLYEVSSQGRVRSFDHYSPMRNRWGMIQKFFAGRILSCKPNKGTGYPMVMLCDGRGGRKQCLVHLLVATAFHGPCPAGKIARHRNGIKADCRKVNLCWVTHKENSADAAKHGHQPRGERQGQSKLTDDKVRWIRKNRGKITNEIMAEKLGVTENAVAVASRGDSWRHVA